MPSISNKKCVLCDVAITDLNDTKEHIIPNAIGGRKKVKSFICNSCNNKSGNDWDYELAKQLNPLCLFFNIKRERGKPPSQDFETTGDEKLTLNYDGSLDAIKRKYIEKNLGSKVHIQLHAKNNKELKQRLKGIKRKYPQINLNEVLENVIINSSYCSDRLKFDFSLGGSKAGRSIVKSVLALVVESGVSVNECKFALNYLKNDDSEDCFGFYYVRDLLKNRPEGIPIHCIAIKASPKTQTILAYVEYFGIQRIVLCLSKSYLGEELVNTYSINPMDGERLNIEVDLNLSEQDIQQSYVGKMTPRGAVEEAINKVLPIGLKNSYQREKERVLQSAITHAFDNCGLKEGEILKPEHSAKLTGLIMEKLEPFILHNISRNRKS